jgi:hypothetical protein
MQAKSRFRDPELAREAAQLRWSRQRERNARDEEDDAGRDDDVRVVKCPARVARIIRALESQAVNGNAHAARELRSWLAEYPPKDEAIRLEDLDRQTRDRLLARLLAELDEEDARRISPDPSLTRPLETWRNRGFGPDPLPTQ